MTALHFAVENNHHNIAKLLISKSSNINAVDLHGRTPLTVAITTPPQSVESKPNRSPNLNPSPNPNQSIKQHKDQLTFIRYLLENGAHVNVQDIEGATPLHHACAVGNVDVCLILLQYGAWLEAKDNEGETPLFYAVREGTLHKKSNS
jgi:ankyrin repeat protein